MPSQKVMEEILKTFIDSNPGPRSIVSWKGLMGSRLVSQLHTIIKLLVSKKMDN